MSEIYGDVPLRDWFAGQAMAGMLAHPEIFDDEGVAKDAYRMADAMLAARGEYRGHIWRGRLTDWGTFLVTCRGCGMSQTFARHMDSTTCSAKDTP